MTLVISFSGGETSAFMLSLLLDMFKNGKLDKKYTHVKTVFANTGQENEETLTFVKKVSDFLKVNVTWIESKTNYDVRKSSSYSVVNFKTADRKGKVFEAMIKKYGIPNRAYLHCTRELKNEPIHEWCEDNFGKDYEIAIGIRLDERTREPKDKTKNKYQTVYPLIEQGYTKQDVIEFWESKPFRLGIENYQGNCRWCWKKSESKLRILAYENKEAFKFPAEMEKLHGLAGHNIDGTKRVFFKNNRSTKDILADSKIMIADDLVYQHEKNRIVSDYNNSLFEGGCSDACEAFTQHDLFDDVEFH